MKLGLVVEGHGEVHAVPVLIRRLMAGREGAPTVEPDKPHRVPRGKLVKEEEIRRAVELVARRIGPGAPILVLLDADDDCPAELAPKLLDWARQQRSDRAIAVVIARSEYEAWFLAAAVSLRGAGGLPPDLEPPLNPEAIRGAKGWLDRQMPSGYAETVDQAKLTARMDLAQARMAPSFDKLVRDLRSLLDSIPAAEVISE